MMNKLARETETKTPEVLKNTLYEFFAKFFDIYLETLLNTQNPTYRVGSKIFKILCRYTGSLGSQALEFVKTKLEIMLNLNQHYSLQGSFFKLMIEIKSSTNTDTKKELFQKLGEEGNFSYLFGIFKGIGPF